MSGDPRAFHRRAADTLASPALLETYEAGTRRAVAARDAALAEWPVAEAMRAWGRRARQQGIERLEEHLAQLTAQIEARGGVVFRAATAREARSYVARLARERGLRRVVKSKSMATEEIELNQALEEAGCQVLETDLGEFVVQLAGERPVHIVTPIMHKTRAEIASLFHRELGTEDRPEAEYLTRIARRHLRQHFLEAEMGVTGANFLVAETGTLVMVTNEGNGRMVTTLPPVHVAVVGIEKVIPRLADLVPLLQILARSATGQKLTAYVSLLNGPRREGERDGPQEFHLVLLDGGRSRIAADPEYREALLCIRCGACLNACPVYRAAGGPAYGSAYPGPIGAVITPLLQGVEEARPLPYASSLCGACQEICPVGIDLPGMLLRLRRDAVRRRRPLTERLAFRLWQAVCLSPRRFRWGQHLLARMPSREGWLDRLPPPLQAWTARRDFPAPRRPFRDRWPELAGTAPAARAAGAARTPPRTREQPVGAPADPEETARRWRPGWAGQPERVIDHFLAELEALQAEPHRVSSRAGLERLLRQLGGGRPILAWPEWGPLLEEARLAWQPLSDPMEAAGFQTGLTGARWAVAETGSLVLEASAEREMTSSLLPDLHVVLLQPDQILPTWLDWLETRPDLSRPSRVVIVTGPSRTSDIEKVLVLGAHGPRRLVVCLLEGELAGPAA